MNNKSADNSAGVHVKKLIPPQENWMFPFLGSILLTVVGGFLDITIDKLAEQDISFDLYYLVPVGISVWYVSIRSGIFIACFSAVSVYVCDLFINFILFQLYQNPPLDTKSMIKAADKLMYQVKKDGKSGLRFAVIS